MAALKTIPPGKITIGVLGSGSEEHRDLSDQVGSLLAKLGVNLLTGAGGGVMMSVSRAYISSPRICGICIGIVPCIDNEHRGIPKDGYPNKFVELPIFTHLPYSGRMGQDDLSRNHINILSSAAVIALPGGEGTISEVELAVRYQKPIIAFAASETLLTRFNRVMERAYHINDVEAFLLKIIARIEEELNVND